MITMSIMMSMLMIFFVLGNGEQGAMTDITNDNRWVLAGFAAFLGSLLIIFGFRKYRIFGVILALILAGGVCSMPIRKNKYIIFLGDCQRFID